MCGMIQQTICLNIIMEPIGLLFELEEDHEMYHDQMERQQDM